MRRQSSGDHLGVPIVITDALGAVATTPNDYLAPAFPGQSRMFSDLNYNRYRDYDPTTGRYIQADPIGLAGGSNPYLYANGNPVNYVDPDGRNPIIAGIIIGGIIGGLIDLDLQLWRNGGRIHCINWRSVAWSAGIGGVTGGIGSAVAPLAGKGLSWIGGRIGSKLPKVNPKPPVARPPNVKNPAEKLADKAQRLPGSKRPNTIAVIRHGNGTFTVGRNQGGVTNSAIDDLLAKVPENCFAGQCAEINALARALNKGRSLEGAEIYVVNVRGPTSRVHGTAKPPCETCSAVLDALGVGK